MFCRDRQRTSRRLFASLAVFSACVFGFLGTCTDFVGTSAEVATKYFDPCGTIFANCEPGSFQLQFADVPDWGVDPTCTIPGGCTTADEPWDDPYDQIGPGDDGP